MITQIANIPAQRSLRQEKIPLEQSAGKRRDAIFFDDGDPHLENGDDDYVPFGECSRRTPLDRIIR